jgi:hypothetical protein
MLVAGQQRIGFAARARGVCCVSSPVRMPGQQPEPLVRTVMRPGSGMDGAAGALGAQLVDTACAAAVYCPA